MAAGSHYCHLGNGGCAYHASDDSIKAIYFKCVFYGCRGRAIYKYNGSFRESQPHNHQTDADFVGERHFRENLLDDIAQRRFVNYQEFFDQLRSDQRYARNVRCRMTPRRLRGSMCLKHMSRYPNIPNSLRDLTRVLLDDNYISRTIDNAENLYAGSCTDAEGHHYIAFFFPRMLRFMSNVKIIQGDGTFKSRPTLPASKQVFVLVTPWDNVVVPLGWFLMEYGTRAAYTSVFSLLRHLSPGLNPQVIMSDCELAQQQAWHEVFPRAQLRGCLWHLGKAFVTKAKSLGLFRYRKALPEIVTYLHLAAAICLLPRRFFMVGLRCLRDAAFEEDIRIAFLLAPFFDYVERRWIRNPVRRRWMTLFRSDCRTNNACETHNRMLRTKVGAYHPNVFLFIQALASLEYNAFLDTQLEGGGGNARRTRRWRSVFTDRELKKLSSNLEREIFHNMDEVVMNFLRRASNLFHGSFQDHIQRAVGPRRRPAVVDSPPFRHLYFPLPAGGSLEALRDDRG